LIKYAKGRVLDVGAGAGRHSLFLQNKGHKVVAIDVSTGALRVMKSRGINDVRRMNIKKTKFPKSSFDTVMFMSNNFGLIGNFGDAKKMLKRAEKFTSKNATIIAGIGNPYITKLKAHLNYHKLNRSRGRSAGQVRIRLEYRNQKGRWFDLLLISPQELEQLIKGTKWRIYKLFNKNKYYYGAVLRKR